LRKGFISARIDGEITELKHNHRVDRYKNHFIEMVIDKLVVDEAGDKTAEKLSADRHETWTGNFNDSEPRLGRSKILQPPADVPHYRDFVCRTSTA
jgi:excinuclease UvrABC ATPase subunit